MNLPCVMPCFYKLVLEMCVMHVAAETGSHSLVCFLLVIIILANFPYNLFFFNRFNTPPHLLLNPEEGGYKRLPCNFTASPGFASREQSGVLHCCVE